MRATDAAVDLPTVRTVHDPRSGQVIEAAVASCLEISFPPTLASRWRIEGESRHLVPLSEGDHNFVFMVFSARTEPEPLRLVRYRVEHGGDVEQRVLHVLPTERGGMRGPGPRPAATV